MRQAVALSQPIDAVHLEVFLDDGFLLLALVRGLRIKFRPADAVAHHQPLGMFLEGLGLVRVAGVFGLVQQERDALLQALELVF